MSILGPGVEFDRIREIAAVLGPRAAELGDDCAMVAINGGFLALSTDVSVDGIHFRRAWLSFEEIGWRAAAGGLSDLAAVGADPVGLLAAITVPGECTDRDVVALMDGVGNAVSAVGGQVLGGDLSQGATLQLAITVVGSTSAWLGRSGAQPGDGIWVTGALGGARAALESWQAGREPAAQARTAFARPEPRVGVGRWLAAAGAHAMMDLSDGLAGDATHLASASMVALTIDLERVPVHPGVPAAGDRAPVLVAAEGGEDYELLVALPETFGAAHAGRCLAETGIPLTRVGQVAAGEGVRLLHHGEPVALRGYDHFR
ncbi:MAG TPA: thiamine-phosphate kinase [Gemmatimonadales bacterium]|nr:thiamine-phosphate kinase [Gemmatimonadales bacterium]